MAQVVGYFQNHVTFTEGPFVMVSAGGWRLEVERKGHHCPVLPQASIYEFLRKNGFNDGKNESEKAVEKAVDFLNRAVEKDEIILVDGSWEWTGRTLYTGCLV